MMDLGVLIKRLRKVNELKKRKGTIAQTQIIQPKTVLAKVVEEQQAEVSKKMPEKELGEEREGIKKGEVDGIKIPTTSEIPYGGLEKEESSIANMNLKYPLIPRNPKKGEEVLCQAQITYNKNKNELVYYVLEPKLSENNQKVLYRVEEILKETLDVDFGELRKEDAKNFLIEKIGKVLDYYRFDITEKDKKVINYYAFRDFVGLGKIEPLINDPNIEDISCDGLGIPVYIFHRNPLIGSIKTNINFGSAKELDSFIIKLAQRCGRSVSVAEPLLDGALPDGSRVQATLGTDIARRGSNFTIRKFTEEPLTPIHLLNFETLNSTMLAYLWLAIEKGKSILIAGPTASGKTSLLNALSLFIRPELKIISIEDTPELRLPHPNWVPEVARSGFGFGAVKSGEVTLDDLLKESLRQRPDYIIVGEVRGSEAYILFQQISTGHPGISTIHASSLEKVMDRLTTKPIDLAPELIASLDILIFINRFRDGNRQFRRINNILELIRFDKEKGVPETNNIFEWVPQSDSFVLKGKSLILSKISKESGIDPKKIQGELVRRRKVIEWMQEKGIQNYIKVGKVISAYYSNPSRVLDFIEGSF